MSKNPEITLKDIPDDINGLIIDKQAEQKKTRTSCNKSQAVLMLLKELLTFKNKK